MEEVVLSALQLNDFVITAIVLSTDGAPISIFLMRSSLVVAVAKSQGRQYPGLEGLPSAKL